MVLDEVTLVGRLVRLEPLNLGHVDGLVAAAGGERDSYGWASVPEATYPAMEQYVRGLHQAWEAGEVLPFAQVRARDGQPVGGTRLLSARRRPEGALYALEIGGTWLAPDAQRSGINSEAKYLLMEYCFGSLRVGRVDIKTDARNERARAAIASLGATFEGALRQWQPSQVRGEEALLRDTAMYSVTAAEWPALRGSLAARIAQKVTKA